MQPIDSAAESKIDQGHESPDKRETPQKREQMRLGRRRRGELWRVARKEAAT
jgi:hypothetical protein